MRATSAAVLIRTHPRRSTSGQRRTFGVKIPQVDRPSMAHTRTIGRLEPTWMWQLRTQSVGAKSSMWTTDEPRPLIWFCQVRCDGRVGPSGAAV